jgi:hypothetical protein
VKSLRRDDQRFEQARERLAAEMDVERLIKGIRYVKNILRVLTSKRERRLTFMQSSMNVLPSELVDHITSSEFNSDHFEPYLKSMHQQAEIGDLTLTNREKLLLTGITPKLKPPGNDIIKAKPTN